MKIVGEYPHPHFKVTLFAWNNKWIIQIEDGPMIQTYKLGESEITKEEIPEFLSEEFYQKVDLIFSDMSKAKAIW